MSFMLCQICEKNDATVHLTEIHDGVRSELHVCELCAQEEGIAAKGQIPLNELLSGLLSTQPSDNELFGRADQTACPQCGFTLEEFKKTGLLGCPGDYEVFESSLRPLLERAHNWHTRHCGKVSSRLPADAKKQCAIAALQSRLEAAVKTENYEEAARLRDEVEKLH